MENQDNSQEPVKYEAASRKVIEVSTPQSTTRFHDESDRVAFDRVKYEEQKQNALRERTAETVHARLRTSYR